MSAGGGAASLSAGRGVATAADPLGGRGGPAILPGVRITPDIVNNTLLIYANQESYRIIERALNQIDRPQLQVAIDITIAEVTLNDKLNYGVQFFLKSSDVGLHSDTGSIINGQFRRRTCCLIYRAAPGRFCGDCVLVKPSS